MEKENLREIFTHYLIPSIASMFSLSLYILADTFFIARGVGSLGLTALNIIIPAYSVLNATGLLLGIGAGVVFSVARGAGDLRRANQVYNTAFWAAIGIGILYVIAGRCFSREIAAMLGASPQTIGYSVDYLRMVFGFGPFFLLNNTLGALVRNDNNPRLGMASMIANSLSNVILDSIFILKFRWGMWGAALATGLSPVFGLCILSLHWIRRRNSFHLERCLPNLRLLTGIIRGGSANFIIEAGNGVVILLFNYTLIRLSGDIGVAAYGIVTNIALVISYLFTGIGQGMQPVVSLRHGQGRPEDCRTVLYLALKISAVLGVLSFLTGMLLPDRLTALFNSENNTQLAAITIPAIRIYFFSFLLMGLNICCASYFQSTLQAKNAAVISLLRGFGLVILGVLTLPRLLGLTGIWLISPLAELCTAILCLYMLYRSAITPAKHRGTPE